MRIRHLIVAVTGILLFVPHLVAAQDQAARGATVYAANKCMNCHSVDGKGNAKGPLDGVGLKYTADELRQWLVDPVAMTAKVKSKRTPAMKPYTLSKEDMDALVAYMQTLKKK